MRRSSIPEVQNTKWSLKQVTQAIMHVDEDIMHIVKATSHVEDSLGEMCIL